MDGTINDDKKASDHHNVELPFEFVAFLDDKISDIQDDEDEDNEVQEIDTLFDNYSNGKDIKKGGLA